MQGNVFRPTFIRRETILDRRTWVYYLIIVDRAAQHWAELLEVKPDERFFAILNEHVKAYVEMGKMPPKEIESTVLNVADDFMAGRDITLRAGDYIAMQNFVRR
jgi:molybdopterin converting factor small subunit